MTVKVTSFLRQHSKDVILIIIMLLMILLVIWLTNRIMKNMEEDASLSMSHCELRIMNNE
jgi:hypothetical protein